MHQREREKEKKILAKWSLICIYIYISICLNIPKLLLRKHWKPPTGQPMPFLALWMTVSFQMKFQWPEKWMAMTLICNSIAGVLRISCWPYWDILRSLTASNSTSCFFHHPGKLHPKKNNKQTKQLWIFCLKKTNWKAEKKNMEQLRKLPVIRSNGSTLHALAVAGSSVGCPKLQGQVAHFSDNKKPWPGMKSVRFPGPK